MCIGKAMGGGMPISAVVGRRDIIERAWPKSTGEALHTSTFLGHPLACAAALAAIEAIVRDSLADRADALGSLLLPQLQTLVDRLADRLVAARGRGLMIGIECRSRDIAYACMLECLRRGLIVLLAGDDGCVIELTPPLTITEEQITWCVSCLAASLESVSPAG
jgi:acetylornithine/succinyldiaminopimelate/putrescine aminotransferase